MSDTGQEASADNALDSAGGALVAQATGLPAPVATGLVHAVSRLLGGSAAIPAAWFRRFTQGIEDKTNARSAMSAELAKAATQMAVNDPRIVERTMWNTLGEGVRKQVNREAVAAEAIKQTQDRVEAGDVAPTTAPDDDWMNLFSRFAEDASSERMQTLWGKVLAGEVRKGGSFSLSTLRFVSELDTDIATQYQKLASAAIRDFIPIMGRELEGDFFNTAVFLESVGLLTGSDGGQSKLVTLQKSGFSAFFDLQDALLIKGDGRLTVPALLLTRTGREMLPLIGNRPVNDTLRRLAKTLQSPPVTELVMTKVGSVSGDQMMTSGPREVLWRAPGVSGVTELDLSKMLGVLRTSTPPAG